MPMLNKSIISVITGFNVLWITETWCNNAALKSYLNLHRPNFDFVSQKRNTNKRFSGVLIHIQKNLSNKLCNNLFVSDKNQEVVTTEVARKNGNNIILSCC